MLRCCFIYDSGTALPEDKRATDSEVCCSSLQLVYDRPLQAARNLLKHYCVQEKHHLERKGGGEADTGITKYQCFTHLFEHVRQGLRQLS